MNKIQIMCYNIHKGRSFFTRIKVTHHIQKLIEHHDPDLVFLQEVRDFHIADYNLYGENQMPLLAKEQYHSAYGKNCTYKNGHHGNGFLSKFPILEEKNFDISVSRLEQRGVLFSKIQIGSQIVYTFCTHLNLRLADRKKQLLLLDKIIEQCVPNDNCAVLLLGDFNDFDKTVQHHYVKQKFHYTPHNNTFPNFYPMFSPDKIFSKNLFIGKSHIIKNRSTLLLSDHLPILLEIEF
jgi:endonuclease/exonuclease/phosphatase family metal-dependent hydrolase